MRGMEEDVGGRKSCLIVKIPKPCSSGRLIAENCRSFCQCLQVTIHVYDPGEKKLEDSNEKRGYGSERQAKRKEQRKLVTVP